MKGNGFEGSYCNNISNELFISFKHKCSEFRIKYSPLAFKSSFKYSFECKNSTQYPTD